MNASDASPRVAPTTLLGSLSGSQREELEYLGTRRSFKRGAVLIFQDELENRAMLLLSGRVKVARMEVGGDEVVLSIRGPGDLIGELALIDGEPRIATVTALEPVEAVVITAAALRDYLEATPRVALTLLEVVARRFRETTVKRSQFAASDTMGRLAARIVELAERYGEPCNDGVMVVSPLSRTELAAWTGASRTGVAQALQAMRDLDWVRPEGRTLLVRDLEALRLRAA